MFARCSQGCSHGCGAHVPECRGELFTKTSRMKKEDGSVSESMTRACASATHAETHEPENPKN